VTLWLCEPFIVSVSSKHQKVEKINGRLDAVNKPSTGIQKSKKASHHLLLLISVCFLQF